MVVGGLGVGAVVVGEVAQNWEALKQGEREPGASLLDSIPTAMPALVYSQAVQRRAAEVGFDWEEVGDVLEKVAEELDELGRAADVQERVCEFGDVLFALTNVARWLGVEAEGALSLANRRFYRRFRYMEEACRQRGLLLHELSFSEMDALWEEAKEKLDPVGGEANGVDTGDKG